LAGGAKALPDPLTAIRRPTSKGSGRNGGEGREGDGEKRRREGKRGRMDGGGRGGRRGRDEGKGGEGGAGAPSPTSCLQHAPASIAAAKKRPFSYQTPQSVHMVRNCGAQTLQLTMHYGGKKWGKIGEGMVGF